MDTLRNTSLWIGAAVVAVVVLVATVLLAGGGDDPELTVSGDALPRYDAAAPGAALGLAAPEAAGADFDGSAVAIDADGTPKGIVFLTHW